MISYAQNHEDIVLARAFSGQTRGFYVDIGAGHPVADSVTRHFYDRGWRGVNIEPSPMWLAQLERYRPQDINLGLGVADSEGRGTLFLGPPRHRGESTFRPDFAARFRMPARKVRRIEVPLTTLARICARYVGERPIDFLKVDVEGYEAKVIAGADFSRWRPRVLVVEATYPNSCIPSHESFEPALIAANYRFGLFDGLNRFYVRAEEPELADRMSSIARILLSFREVETPTTG